MGANEGRGRTAQARVRAVATPELYRRNPFRITGLTAGATRREVRERRLRVLGVLEVGGAVPDGVPADASVDDVRAAFDALGNTEHRFVDEVFWLWGLPTGCGCPNQLHQKHDNAVAAHAAALDAEAERTDDHPTPLWTEAARCWTVVLRSDSFWQHLAYRVEKLGDRRLDESTVDGLRTALPGAVLAPLIDVALRSPEPQRLMGYLDEFGADRHTVEDARTAIADGTYRHLEGLLKSLRSELDGNRAETAAERAVTEAAPLFDRLDDLVPRTEFRRTATLSEATAVVANNIGVALADVRDAPSDLLRDVFALARRCTLDPETLEAVGRNERMALETPVFRQSTRQAVPVSRILYALLHGAAGIAFLVAQLPDLLPVVFLVGAPGLLVTYAGAGNPRVGPMRYPVLLGIDAGLYLGLGQTELPAWVAIGIVAVLLVVAPVIGAGRGSR
ncbi:hypothetical protein [Amycolatopsis jejuensis]|uniref:hypothetical protein n=1 Tax=Amycolatopsis jejuensis TaxID=330084 RepID=UPI000524CB64|nr:hypothetical protein [Amycolatopsis jejuensis]